MHPPAGIGKRGNSLRRTDATRMTRNQKTDSNMTKRLWATMLLATTLGMTAATGNAAGTDSSAEGGNSPSCSMMRADKNDPVMRIDKTGNYDRVEMRAIGEVFYTQSAVPTFKVYGPSEIVDALDVNCDNGTLTIDCQTEQGSGKDFKNIRIYISSPSLEYVRIDGIAEFYAEDRWEADNPVFMLDGIGKLRVHDLRCKTLDVIVEGIGDAEIDVHCDTIRTSNHGIGKIKLRGETQSLTRYKAGIGKTYTKGLKVGDNSSGNAHN